MGTARAWLDWSGVWPACRQRVAKPICRSGWSGISYQDTKTAGADGNGCPSGVCDAGRRVRPCRCSTRMHIRYRDGRTPWVIVGYVRDSGLQGSVAFSQQHGDAAQVAARCAVGSGVGHRQIEFVVAVEIAGYHEARGGADGGVGNRRLEGPATSRGEGARRQEVRRHGPERDVGGGVECAAALAQRQRDARATKSGGPPIHGAPRRCRTWRDISPAGALCASRDSRTRGAYGRCRSTDRPPPGASRNGW